MAKAETSKSEFKGLRALLWPIHNYELKKFIPLALLMFCILFNYTAFRNTKDTLILTAADAGTITFLKTYCVTPMAILFVVLYVKMSNVFNAEKIFYATMIPFLAFFGLFAFVLNPNLSAIQPSAESVEVLIASYPRLAGFIKIYQNWAYSLFFIMSELWGSMLLSLSFWQFANYIVRMNEAKRFYGLFVVVANISTILSGITVKYSAELARNFTPAGSDQWDWSLKTLISIAIVMGVICMGIFRWMHTSVLTDPKYFEPPKETKGKKKKPGLVESAKIVFTSPELGLIASLIICYGITINLVEVQWKNQVKLFFGTDKNAMNAFMGSYSAWTGVATIIFALFFGSNILRRLGWFFSAAFTPVVILALGGLFFGFIFAKGAMEHLISNPIYAAALVGAGVIIASKAAKYCLFDPTKEMAYIPLDPELKSKGKAAVDVIGGRLGKSGGALTQTILLMVMGTTNVLSIAPIASGVFVVMCIVWLYAVKGLSNKLKVLDKNI
ncbi:Npt1/Npt2 family nucleotide transporter [Candidatus Deianiraea vastatrix]|uniref:ADP,ATP carrier protein n=1 Tax=Candidatus Deianiraea vastatrix TaxID=2163644 RepID=A0A5B8XEK2_9RICK|nr:Npt1/Npt2 family nucleotide transporter [Candidatus Deianiraea vastatrix]QED23315.1 ADP,ATP carrier protein 1 [Candidatus Deianiraea vastatrix]